MTTSCQAPVPFEALIAYHMRELSEADAERVEEHYFSCAYCSERLELMSRFEQGVRASRRARCARSFGTCMQGDRSLRRACDFFRSRGP